ncbi:hypothetical protein HDU79_007664 [Rhizoclosmatium sp. JEL0117]|nr:hypothetical protein HDU79_007664 [Rhizoclosmatium sp. JEL0117]
MHNCLGQTRSGTRQHRRLSKGYAHQQSKHGPGPPSPSLFEVEVEVEVERGCSTSPTFAQSYEPLPPHQPYTGHLPVQTHNSPETICSALNAFSFHCSASNNNPNSGSSPLQHKLPTEIVHKIFALLHPTEATKCLRLSRAFYHCLSDPHFAALNLSTYINIHTKLTSPTLISCHEFDRLWFKLPLTYQLVYAQHRLSQLTLIAWSKRHLRGAIPQPLGLLTNLVHLDLSCNSLRYSIPPELGNCTRMETLNLGANELTGEIPYQIGALASLKTLNISGNHLRGCIPWSIGELTQLTHLDLNSNCLTGLIPYQLGRLFHLESLILNTNLLSGWIPTELANLVNLVHLDIGSNLLSGPLPISIANLQNLRFIVASNNQLSGLIPVGLSQLPNLEYVDLKANLLCDPVPVGLQHLPNLAYLNLSDNYIVKADVLMERVEATWENESFIEEDIV